MVRGSTSIPSSCTHDAKAAALFGYYSTLLGQAPDDRWAFNVDALYDGCPRLSGLELVAPFSASEIKKAVDSMDRSSAPGPDGLGQSFYRAAWASILPQVIRLFDAFHAGNVDLDSINRAHVVLLPWHPRPWSFSPDLPPKLLHQDPLQGSHLSASGSDWGTDRHRPNRLPGRPQHLRELRLRDGARADLLPPSCFLRRPQARLRQGF
jgi:hypothetical protein